MSEQASDRGIGNNNKQTKQKKKKTRNSFKQNYMDKNHKNHIFFVVEQKHFQ